MDEISQLYKEHCNKPFPELTTDEILGIELPLLDSDSAGLIEKFIHNKGQLSLQDEMTIKNCNSELKTIVKELTGYERLYFSKLLNLTGLIIDKLKLSANKQLNDLIISDRPDWRLYFDQVRQILNNWDPLGVADQVEDEYDTMNIRITSVLINQPISDKIKEVIKDYSTNSMCIQIDDRTLDELTAQLMKIGE